MKKLKLIYVDTLTYSLEHNSILVYKNKTFIYKTLNNISKVY